MERLGLKLARVHRTVVRHQALQGAWSLETFETCWIFVPVRTPLVTKGSQSEL